MQVGIDASMAIELRDTPPQPAAAEGLLPRAGPRQSVPIAAIKLLVLRYVELKLSQIVSVLSKIGVKLNKTLLQNNL